LPHLIIEYSANLEAELDFPAVLTALRDAALATGIFPLGGIRVRAYATDHDLIADGDPSNAFVHVMLRVGHGSDAATLQRACEKIFAAACAALQELYRRRPLGISLELQELPARLSLKQNNLHEYVEKRKAAAAAGEGT